MGKTDSKKRGTDAPFIEIRMKVRISARALYLLGGTVAGVAMGAASHVLPNITR